MNKNYKNIEQRHKEEEKEREKNEKQRIKDMKKTQKYQEKVGLTPGNLMMRQRKKAKNSRKIIKRR